jgi:hypothetical protein
MATARWFDKSKLEKGVSLPFGIPQRDLSDEEFNAYPAHIQRSIDSWPVFAKRNPNPTPRTPKEDKEA